MLDLRQLNIAVFLGVVVSCLAVHPVVSYWSRSLVVTMDSFWYFIQRAENMKNYIFRLSCLLRLDTPYNCWFYIWRYNLHELYSGLSFCNFKFDFFPLPNPMFFSWGLAYGVDFLICDLLILSSSSGDVLTQPGFILCLFLPGLTFYRLLSYFNSLHYPRQDKRATWTTHGVKDLSNGEWGKETPPWLREFLARGVARFGTGTSIWASLLFGAFEVFRNLAPYHISHLTSQDFCFDQSPKCAATTQCQIPVAPVVNIVESSPSLWTPFSVCCLLCVLAFLSI